MQESDHAPCNTCKCPHLNCCDCSCLHIQQTPLSDASRKHTCKPPSRLDRLCVPIQQAETNHFLMVSRHMQAPIPPRFHGPCVHILQAEKQSVHAQTPAPCPLTRCDRLPGKRIQAKAGTASLEWACMAGRGSSREPPPPKPSILRENKRDGGVGRSSGGASRVRAAAARKRHQARQTCRMTRGWWRGWWSR